MAGMNLRNSPFPPFSENAGVSESLRSPYRGEELSGGGFPEGSDKEEDLLDSNAVTALMRGFQPKPQVARAQRGRPRKRTEALFADVLRGHRAIAVWFAREVGRPARSDVELFECFRAYAYSLAIEGSREANVFSMGYSLKTVQNVLGQARRYFKKHPEKCPFLGVDGGDAAS